MKKIILVLACLFPLAGIAQDKFEITGTLSAVGTGRTVLLRYKNSEGKEALDSAIVQNGKFDLTGTTAFGNKATISLLPIKKVNIQHGVKRDELLFFLEKGKYILTGTDSITNAMITGTQVQKEYLEYLHERETPSAQYMSALMRFMKASSAKDSVEMKKIQTEFKPLNDKVNAVRDSFIFNHPDSYVTLDLVVNEMGVVENPSYYKVLSKRMLKSFVGQKLTDRMEKSKLIALGKTIDFTQPDDKGKLFKLSSLRGKYVLVDFWASWCGPCRGETPYLINAYKTFKDKNLEIVSISLDETRAAWMKAVADDEMTWIQVSDLKGFKNEVANRFGIVSIPRNVLVDPNGVIIAKNLRGEDVTKKISELIK